MLPDLRCPKRWKAIVCALALAAAYAGSEARAQGARPFTLEQLEKIVKSGLIAEARLVTLLGERCVDFVADEASLTRLRAAGATDPVLEAVRRACRVLPGEARWVRIEPRRAELRVGKEFPLTAVVLAGDSSEIRDASVRWASSDSTKVAVGADGRATAKARGVAVITATVPNGVADSLTIRAFTGGRVQITPYAGLFIPTSNVVDQVDVQTKHQAAVSFGGRVTGWITERLGLEGSVAFSPSGTETSIFGETFDDNSNVVIASGRLVARLSPPGGSSAVHGLAGVGVLSRGGDAYTETEGTTDVAFVFGGGVQFMLGRAVGIRLDVEDYVSGAQFVDPFTGEESERKVQNDIVLSGGLAIRLGS